MNALSYNRTTVPFLSGVPVPPHGAHGRARCGGIAGAARVVAGSRQDAELNDVSGTVDVLFQGAIGQARK